MSLGKLYIGTSGWVYPHWKGVFYPSDLPLRKQLTYYSKIFDATEINSSFYRLPSAATVEHWSGMVKPNFRFCPKISRWVTHAKKLNDPESSCPRFFDIFEPYRKMCGPVLIQLPAMLAFHPEKANHFFSFLRRHYSNWQFSLEVRHASWFSSEAQSILRENKIGWVIAESGDRWASSSIITARHIYLRFHGPDGSYATPYSDKFLRRQAALCRDWISDGRVIWIFFNNDIHGYAIANAKRLRDLSLTL